MGIRDVENILEVYTLSEVIEYNDLNEIDVLHFLVEAEFLRLPNPEPLDFDD